MTDENFVKDLKADNVTYTLLGVDLANSDSFTARVRDDCNKIETVTVNKDDLFQLQTEKLTVHINNEKLPTADEFIKANEPSVLRYYKQEKWSEPKYICPKCNEGGMRKENDVVYTSNPPCYKYQCDKCGNTTWHHF